MRQIAFVDDTAANIAPSPPTPQRLPLANRAENHLEYDVDERAVNPLGITACDISDPTMTVITTIEVLLNQPYDEASRRRPWWPSGERSR